jgi:hypothetical protein
MNKDIEKKIISEITDYYIQSGDFNGLPASHLIKSLAIDADVLQDIILRLVKEGKIEVSTYINPHIRAFDCPIEKQIDHIKSKEVDAIVLYPSKATLENIVDSGQFNDKLFSRMLLLGHPQLQLCYFDLSVLERYRNDPRYDLDDDGTTLSLCNNDESCFKEGVQNEDDVFLEHFGYAYIKENKTKCLAVPLCYIQRLPAKHQKYWESHMLNGACLIDRDFAARMSGEFTENYSIYEAILEEEKQVSILCNIIGLPPLFTNAYDCSALRDFSTLIRPTEKYYSSFAHLLDKVVIENINRDFFKGRINLDDEMGKPIPTIRLLEMWQDKFYKTGNLDERKGLQGMYEAFRNLRKLRIPSAHKIISDKYDEEYYKKQRDLTATTYYALRTLRELLNGHPKVQKNSYSPPDWLEKREIKF